MFDGFQSSLTAAVSRSYRTDDEGPPFPLTALSYRRLVELASPSLAYMA